MHKDKMKNKKMSNCRRTYKIKYQYRRKMQNTQIHLFLFAIPKDNTSNMCDTPVTVLLRS